MTLSFYVRDWKLIAEVLDNNAEDDNDAAYSTVASAIPANADPKLELAMTLTIAFWRYLRDILDDADGDDTFTQEAADAITDIAAVVEWALSQRGWVD